MKLIRKTGVTSEIWQIFIQDSSSTTGAGLANLTSGSSGLVGYWHRDTDTTATAISFTSMTVGTFTSQGFAAIDNTNMPGWYQFCPPNTSIAAGAKSCGFLLRGVTNMAPLPIEVQLVSVDVDDSVRYGLTSLPNAAAEAAGGLYTRGSGAGQITQDANGRVNTNTVAMSGTALTARDIGASVLLSSGTSTGQISLTSGAVTVGTNNDKTGYSLTQTFPTNFSLLSIDGLGRVDVGKWIGGVIPAVNITGVPLVDLKYTLGTISPATAGYVGVDWGQLTNKTATNALTNTSVNAVASVTGPVSLSAPDTSIVATGTAVAGGSVTITLQTALGADNLVNGSRIKITSGTGVKQSRTIIAYVDSTKVVTVDRNWVTNPDNTSVYAIVEADEAALNSTLQVISSDIKAINGVSVSSVSAINANIGTTQPINHTGTSTSALVKTDVIDIAGTASAGTAGYVGIDWSHINAPTTTVGLTGTTISSTQVIASVTAGPGIRKNVALPAFEFLMTNATTQAPMTGLTVSVTRSVDGGSFSSGTLSAVSEVGSGIYAVDFGSGDLNGNVITLQATATSANTTFVTLKTSP